MIILPFHKIGRSDANKAGGKGASLGEMTQAGIPVPPGFVVLAEAFEAFIDANNVRSEIHDILEHLDHNSVTSIESSSARIQELILAGDIPENIQREMQTYQKDITTDFVAVRSSATAEDGIEHAWAGQLDTYLNVPKNAIEKKIQSCWASLFTPRALFYRSEKGLVDIHISVAVVVQSMVDAESAGVAFSVHPVTENTDEIVIEGSWGLGEAVVSGEVTPDSFVVSKSSRETLSQHISDKKKGIFRNTDGLNEWRQISEQERKKPVLTKKALNELSELVIHIENHYGFPCDIEWAYTGGKIYILQARPITTLKKVTNGETKNSPYKKINEDSYDFLWTVGFPYIYCSMFLESGYKEIDTISFNKGNSYTQFIGKKDRELLSEKGLQLYLKEYEEYEKNIKKKRAHLEQKFKCLEEIKLEKVDNSDLRKLFHEVVQIFIEIWSDYFVTEYHHTDKIGDILKNKEESRNTEVLQKNVEKMGHFKLYQREFINKFMYEPSLIDKYLREIKSRYNLKYEIEWYSYTEILDILENKEIDVPDRKNGVIRGKFSNWQEIIGEEANNIYKQLENIDKNTSIIRGKTGNKGRYTGKVKKIAFSVETDFTKEIENMTQGQILVSGSTGPEMILACKKAGAIITDEGGIISHAAIISRELNIPSIIGTKIATKILEDGDLVEVDADNGVVRILEKKRKKISKTQLFPNGVVKMGRWSLPLLSSECWNSEVTQQRFFEKLGIWREFIVLHEINPDFQNPYYSNDFFDTLKNRLDELYNQDSKALFNKVVTFYDEDIEAKKSIDKLSSIDLKKLTNEELSAIFLENRRLVAYITVYDQIGWLCENYLYSGISQILEKKGLKKGSQKFIRCQFSLTQPEHISTTLKEKQAVLESSERIKSGVSTIEIESKKLSDDFGYMPVFAYGRAWDAAYYREQLEDIITTDRDLKNEIENLKNYSSTQKKDFSKASRQLNLSSEEQQKFIDFGLILDARNEAEYFVSYAGKHLVAVLDEVSTRLDMSTEKLLNMLKSEIASLLNGELSKENVLSRRKRIAGWGYLDESGLRKVFDGEEAEDIFKTFENEKIFIQGNTEERGVCGSPGKMQGKIRIVHNPSENAKVQTGDILVTYATTVDYLPAMKKAGAIITEVGGITCHAAVVSREFRIPCIIAFKNAMEYFSDGDFVEVDADNGVVNILEKKKNIFEQNWQIGATRNMPLWHDILCLYGWEDNMRDYGVDEKCKCLFAIESATHATMFMQVENQKKYFEATAKLCKDGRAVKKLRKKYEIYAHDVQKSLEKLMQQNSVENLEIFLKHYQRFTAGLWITTGFGRIGTENLEKTLVKVGIQQEKIPEYISTLTYPEEHTPLFASQKDMLILGEKIQSGKKINRKKEILRWLENHKFIPVNFCEDPWTQEDAEKQLADILEQDCKVALQELDKSHGDKLKEKRRLHEELDQDISDISDALAEATSLNEYRKNIFCRLSYSIRFVFEKMMKKVGSSNWRDAYYCTPDEMVEICRGKNIDIQKIKEERQKCVLVREGDSIAWGSESIIQDYFEKIYNKNEESGKSLTGFSANKGKITGRVKVVLSTRDFHKVNRGDILVATMTSVDFVPIMEKAGAFVTNEGGITSHAAIVAREMDKPCIIGAKNATRVLQDGYLIEVDADNGVIKILEKEESLLENKDLEVWIERKQSIFSMSVFHELESKIMREHLGGGFKTQICFMKDKVCSYIHEIGDFEHVIQNIAQKLQKKSTKDQENYIKEMNRWENIGNKIIKNGSNPVLLSESAMREYLENYKNIGYWTTVVPYFLLEAIHALGEEKYKKLQKICERLRSNSLYPILNEKITLKVLEHVSLKMGLSHEDAYYITWQETVRGLDGGKPKNKKSIGERKHKDNAFYRNQSGEVLFLDNEEEKEKLRQISYPKEANKLITGKTSYPGKAIGKVRILRTREDMQHFETGDVLVSPNSNPSLIGCIKKCSAMVTDEGGVSCHAAIISRELKIPCIIGTKVATKVLQDGDLVEVDADNGVVKKVTIKEDGESLLNLEKYQRLFSFYGHLPFIFSYIFSKTYLNFGGIVFSDEKEWLSYISKENLHDSFKEGIQIYGNKKQYESFRSSIYAKIKEIKGLKEEIINKGINGNRFILFMNMVTEYRSLYTKTEFFYTEKIFEERKKYPDFRRNFQTFEKLKIDGRKFLNELFYSEQPIFIEVLLKISEKLNITKKELLLYTTEEIVDAFRKKRPSKQQLSERENKYMILVQNNAIKIYGNQESKKYIEFIKLYNAHKPLIGKTASSGKVKAEAYVIKVKTGSYKNISKIVEEMPVGSALVVESTEPTVILACKKASAIITNQGGMMSHAATISRELKIPCIVGVGNATDLINTGDIIEVDADNGTIKILEKENEIQWAFTYDRQMSYQRIGLFHHGYCTRLSDFFDVNIANELYRIQDGIVSVFYDEVSHKQAFEKIRDLLEGEKKAQWYKKIYNTITKDYRDFIDFLDQGEKKKDIKNLGKALSEHMEYNRKIGLSTWLLYSYVEEILSDEVKIMLAKKGIKNQQEIFQILSQPDEMIPNDTWEYDIAQACLAESKKQQNTIKKLCLKYRSYGMYDVMFDGKNERDIQEKITSIKKIEAQKIIKNLDEKYSKQKSELKKIETIKWSETESLLMQLYRLYANFKDWKNFHRERSSYQIRDIYKAIAKKYKQKQEYLSYMTEAEILKGIKQKKWPRDGEIEKRKKNSAIVFFDKITKNILEIEKLQELDKKLFIEKNSLSGTTAFPGNITGTARIINSHDDLKKLEKGDIMVSSTTRPDYLPFMSDIEGFVTNEGGVLSHAAILAREIRKPCIIGTKIATQVIKSGDKITMDGKNGIITIHQKKKNYLENKKLLSEGGRACYLYPNRIFCTRMNIPHPLWENHLMVISTSENHKVNWYFAVDDEGEFDYTLRRVLENKNMLEKGEKEINRLVRKAQKTLKKQYKTGKEAWSGYEKFISIYEEIAIVPTFVRQLDRAVVRSLRESIHGEEDFAIAVYPAKRTYQRQEEIALLELRTKFDNKITTDIQKRLDKIYAQYFTSGLGYFEEQIKTKSDYREKLVGNSRKEAKDHLKKIIEEEKEIMQKKQKLKRILPEKAQIIDIAGFLVYLKDHYKFQINRVQHYAEGLFRSISALSGYDESLIRDMTPDEVKNLLLLKKIDEKNIQKRIAYHAYVYNDSGEPELIIGEEAKAFTQKYLATNNLQKSFSGRVACKGQGRGKAKVILGTRDFHKMEQGDILVVMNTSPDFVPIMKKAAAIVAEEGGITGHVSVVSREFGIPSVVGIKQITSIVQDGEIIEVDALKGVVTRIK